MIQYKFLIEISQLDMIDTSIFENAMFSFPESGFDETEEENDTNPAFEDLDIF
jgi:hypothetical protein